MSTDRSYGNKQLNAARHSIARSFSELNLHPPLQMRLCCCVPRIAKLRNIQIKSVGHGGALRVDRKLLDRVERDFRAVDAALGPVRILGADAYMRVQACTWSLNTADFERRPGKGHRNANGISADVI